MAPSPGKACLRQTPAPAPEPRKRLWEARVSVEGSPQLYHLSDQTRACQSAPGSLGSSEFGCRRSP